MKAMTDKNTKHNWFQLNGEIRIEKKMTTKEFVDMLDALGLEFQGTLEISETRDEDYE